MSSEYTGTLHNFSVNLNLFKKMKVLYIYIYSFIFKHQHSFLLFYTILWLTGLSQGVLLLQSGVCKGCSHLEAQLARNVQSDSFTWLSARIAAWGCWPSIKDLFHLTSLHGLGFSQHDNWDPRGSIPSMQKLQIPQGLASALTQLYFLCILLELKQVTGPLQIQILPLNGRTGRKFRVIFNPPHND